MTKEQRLLLCQKLNVTPATMYNWESGKTKKLDMVKKAVAALYADGQIDFIPEFLK